MLGKIERIYRGPAIFIAHVIGGIGIASGYWLSTAWLVIPLCLLFLWDVGFAFVDRPFLGRNSAQVNEAVARGRTYISWFFAFYGIVLGAIIQKMKWEDFVAICKNAKISPIALALPMLITLGTMLFIPFRLEKEKTSEDFMEKDKRISNALITLYVSNAFFEKVILILMGHLLLRLMVGWQELVPTLAR